MYGHSGMFFADMCKASCVWLFGVLPESLYSFGSRCG